ncbi:MAG TPA: UDP-glucose 4-epimerase GalE [Rhizomicrobium sp.]|nr:UDP-glucose 4-epimerase GalE [Rhizomicrobium sp.]
MAILITGGAGYIGSHMVHEALERGEKVVVLDNLSTGSRGLVAENAVFVEGNAGDQSLVKRLIAEHKIDAIIHFAGSIVVPDSVAQPLAYYANNTVVARNLIEAAVESHVPHFIFSSTAAVYGEAHDGALTESTSTDPINPYGRSKLMTEWMLEDASKAFDFRFVALRYFNVAGADPSGRSGQSSPRATHLIKRGCQVALGRLPQLDIFGTDYPTPDGTGVRDYIHVSDLVAAHALALDYLRDGGAPAIMNCGYGHGASVREVIGSIERVAGHTLPVREAPRRPGDPPSLVADASLIRKTLRWTPQHDDLDEIVTHALAWERRLNAAG